MTTPDTTRIGNYELIKPLARGGMAQIFVGRHCQTGDLAAIKILLPQLSKHDTLRQRFHNEARSIAAIRHRNVITLQDFGTTPDGDIYLAMEYVDGITLTQWLDLHPRPPVEDILSLGAQLADALAAIHAQGITHRDLKPSNIMLTTDPASGRIEAKILDFGIAKILTGEDHGGRITGTGMIVGTPHYMSPEQCRGASDIDYRADIYSLGVILYEMVTGRCPHQPDSNSQAAIADVVAAHLRNEPEPPRRHRPQISSDLEALILRCLAKAPGDRIQTMQDLAAALRAQQDSHCSHDPLRPFGDVPVVISGARRGSRRPRFFPAGLLLLAAGIMSLVAAFGEYGT